MGSVEHSKPTHMWVRKEIVRIISHGMGTLVRRRDLFDNDMEYLSYIAAQRPRLLTNEPKHGL